MVRVELLFGFESRQGHKSWSSPGDEGSEAQVSEPLLFLSGLLVGQALEWLGCR
jgi:hypothetical protein